MYINICLRCECKEKNYSRLARLIMLRFSSWFKLKIILPNHKHSSLFMKNKCLLTSALGVSVIKIFLFQHARVTHAKIFILVYYLKTRLPKTNTLAYYEEKSALKSNPGVNAIKILVEHEKIFILFYYLKMRLRNTNTLAYY